MDSLMSNIMASANARLYSNEFPIDLTWNKYTNHTCDRLISQEDLRSEWFPPSAEEELGVERQISSSSTSAEEYESVVVHRPWHKPSPSLYVSKQTFTRDSSLDETAFSSVLSVSIKQEQLSPAKEPQRPHPFSIQALIGSSETDTARESSPAQVFSSNIENSAVCCLHYESFVGGLSNHQHVPILCPVRPDSVSTSRFLFWCHVCNALCVNKDDASHHQHTHRLQQSKCNLRRLIFKETGYVTTHEQEGDNKMKCGLCNKVVANCFFSKHQRLHNGHFCDVCDQEFSTNSRLHDHLNVHTGSTKFSCKLCDRQFAKRSSLTQHQRYHRDHNSFKCQYCAKYFNSKYASAVHERLHTGINPFKCSFPGCKRAFPQKVQLKLHMNSRRHYEQQKCHEEKGDWRLTLQS